MMRRAPKDATTTITPRTARKAIRHVRALALMLGCSEDGNQTCAQIRPRRRIRDYCTSCAAMRWLETIGEGAR